MKKILFIALSILFLQSESTAQFLTQPTQSKEAHVSEVIGITTVSIDYFRPGVNGREGQIWGSLVPYNEGDPIPWRAGANDNTVISFEHDVMINGNPLPAGKYGIHMIPSKDLWIIIFSHNYTSWGSFSYNPEEDALRIIVEPQECPHEEWLSYNFVNQTNTSADVRLSWETRMGQFTVEVDVHNIVLDNMRKELRNNIGFTWQGWQQAAAYCLQNDVELEQGLEWANRSISGGFGATPTFTNLNTKAQLLVKLDRAEEAEEVLDQALEIANMTELHFYARSLIQQGDNEGAMEIFQLNRKRNPDDKFTTLVGLARGHMALGQGSEAAELFRLAAQNAPAGQAQFYLDLADQAEAKNP